MPVLWDVKQRQGHMLHRICPYQGSFPPQLPAYFLDSYKGNVVLDPFCGRGTVLLEAVLRGRYAIGVDLLRTAQVLSGVKLMCPERAYVMREIDALDLSSKAPPIPEEFSDLYHKETWRQVWNLRKTTRSQALTALALGRLHGHSPGFFSTFTFNVVSVRPKALKRLRAKHGTELPVRDVKEILRRAAQRFIPEQEHRYDGEVVIGDARHLLHLESNSVDLVITSPPFFDVVDYPDVNWVRQWFLGAADTAKQSPFSIPKAEDYLQFLVDVLTELRRVVKPRGVVVFEVGPVKRNMKMADLVIGAAQGIFDVEKVVVNEFGAKHLERSSVPKISRAMGKGASAGTETTTTANMCVVMRNK